MNEFYLPPLADSLLRWYEANRRPLPWRENATPYRVWISEIMLQQTRIEAARGYFERFTAALPDVQALAAADEQTVLKLWEGLGYYSRARNLHKAAKQIVSEYNGALPADAELLRSLPGIGDYTAGAIASIAFGLPEPAVDGNVLRVCSRVAASERCIAEPAVKRDITEALRSQYPAGRCGDFTSALMELGETVCTPGTPDCHLCPLAGLCRAFAEGKQAALPVMPQKKPRRIQQRTILLLEHNGAFALQKRPNKGLLAGLWEFPAAEEKLSEAQAMALAEKWGCAPEEISPCGDAVHIFTHIEWHMTGYRLRCGKAPSRFVWAENAEQYALPSAFRAYRALTPWR